MKVTTQIAVTVRAVPVQVCWPGQTGKCVSVDYIKSQPTGVVHSTWQKLAGQLNLIFVWTCYKQKGHGVLSHKSSKKVSINRVQWEKNEAWKWRRVERGRWVGEGRPNSILLVIGVGVLPPKFFGLELPLEKLKYIFSNCIDKVFPAITSLTNP